MAGNNYKLLLEADFKPDKIQARVAALNKQLKLDFRIDDKSLDKLSAELQKITAAGGKLGKIKLFEDDNGRIAKATIEYTNLMGQVEKTTKRINSGVKITKERYVDINNVLKQQATLQQNLAKQSARQADEMQRAALNADKFLAKSQNMAKSAGVQAVVSKAQDIKVAVSEGDIEKVRKLNNEFAVLKSGLQTGRTGLDSWTAGMKNAMKQTVEYALSIGLVYGALRQIKEGIQYVSELNKEMTNIRLVTGFTQEQTAQLAMGYNDLAKDVGATTMQVAQSSVEWFRQGKTIEETNELVRSSMMLSKLGNVEAAQSTEYLTSIINGFKLEAKDVTDVISKLVALDNAFATSTSEIASAMQRSSVSAQQAGVSLDQLASMITTVSDVTRRAPESIGEAFKTMFARYQDILAGQVDEDGMGINNVGKALERVGINIRDVDGGFRDFSDVLDELYGKWQSLDEIEQANILKAMAGIRQRETLLVLLENETKYRKALLETQNAQGLAEERYAIYLEGVEAAQNKLTAAWEGMWQETISSGAITWWLDFGSAMLEAVHVMGGLKGVILAVAVALGVMNLSAIANGFVMLTATVMQGVTALYAMATGAVVAGTAMNAALGVIGVLIGVGILAFNAISSSIETTTEKLERLNQEIETHTDNIGKMRDSISSFNKLSESYDELSSKAKLTKEESQELLDVQNGLKDLMPELIGHYDDFGNFIIDDTTALKNFTQATKDQIEAEKLLLQLKADEKAAIQAESLMAAMQSKITADRGFTAGRGHEKLTEVEIAELNLDWSKAIAESKVAFSQMSDEGKNAFIQQLKSNNFSEEVVQEFENSLNQVGLDKAIADTLSTPDYEERIKEVGDKTAEYVFESFTATLEGLLADDETLSGLMDKSVTGELDFSDIAKIPEEYLDALTVEGDKLRLNTDLIRERQIVEAEASLETIKMAYSRGEATAQEVSVIQLYLEKLKEQQYVLIGTAQVASGVANQIFFDIANQAAMSGNSFVDLQGKALTSVDAIYRFLQSGDQAFNSFVMQAANSTGRSVEQVMNAINGMISSVYNNAATAMNNLNGAITSGPNWNPYASQSGVATPKPLFTPAPVGMQYPGGLSSGGGGSGGGGGESKKDKKKREAEERARELEDKINQAQEDATENLKEQLNIYKEMVDAKKDMLDALVAERNYNQDVEEQNKNILEIQNELAALQFDDSAEADARRLELEDQLTKAQQELSDTEFDRSIELQKESLDADYAAFEDKINAAIQAIGDISAGSMSEFASKLAEILSQIGSVPAFHSGAEKGVVGSSGSAKSGEVFAKLMAGEIVTNEAQASSFLRNTLPQLAEASSTFNGGNIQIDMPINVNGNLDKSTLPDLKRFVEAAMKQINDNMLNRGYTRNAAQFSI